MEERSVTSLALPITISTISDSLLSLVALITVAKLSTTAVAATGLAAYLFFVINALASVFTGGLMVVLAQAIGARKEDIAGSATGETLCLAFVLSVLIVLSTPYWLSSYFLAVSSGNAEVTELALEYTFLRLLSLPALFVNIVLASLYRSVDKPWPSVYASLINLGLGLLLIPLFTLGGFNVKAMGLKGAGFATTISSYFSLVAYAIWKPPIRIQLTVPGRLSLKVLMLGTPMALERFVASIAHNIYVNAVAKGGTIVLAAHNIGVNVESLIIQPSFAISLATLVRTGQETGARNLESVSARLREGVVVGAITMGLAALALVALSPFAGYMFTSDPEIIRLTQAYLVLAALSEIGFGISNAFYGAMRGMGSVWLPLFINMITVVFFRAIPAQVLAEKYGAIGAWATQNTDMYGRALLASLAWRILGARRLAKRVF
ncbi:MAG: MATE family efflux transporter [Infirmifilum sp.]